LTVASSWAESERKQIEVDFQRWMAENHGTERAPKAGWIRWVPIPREEDLEFVVNPSPRPFGRLGGKVDLVVGIECRHLAALAGKRRWLEDDGGGDSPWFVVRRLPIGMAVLNSESDSKAVQAKNSDERSRLAFDDPRYDPLSFAWAKKVLETGAWAEGYAQLVESAGEARQIGRRPGSALAAVSRGEARSAPATPESVASAGKAVRFTLTPGTETAEWVEGGAILAGTPRVRLARWFRDFLRERLGASPAESESRGSRDADDLLSDLLGATLVDTQDELWEAWTRLERTGHPKRPTMWMMQAPPWPPASITKLAETDPSGTLVQTLAVELAPDADIRAWLLRDWLGPPRLIDGQVLTQIATAVDGRLMREPRFRAWLRAEWTAWARQRYRRVARMAREWEP